MSMSAQVPPTMSWQDQLLDVLRARERTWIVAAALLILLGALLALLAPGTLPPTPLVGLAVGAAAVLLATAVVIGLDVSDVIVRGPRHVENAGGHVAGTISRATSDIDALIDLIDVHDVEGKVRVALTPASRSAGVPGSRANIVAAELAGRGAKVLVTDLTRGGTPAVGLSDVIAGDRSLGEAVRFDDELYLAHLAVGSEPELALEGFSSWARGLPPDLDVLVAALPPLSEPGVLQAVDGVELVLLLVEVGRTERVDLIASLDAIDAAGVPAELVLVDDAAEEPTTTGSGSVEVLSTPGSTPRQRDPSGFDLHDDHPDPDPDPDDDALDLIDPRDGSRVEPNATPPNAGGPGAAEAGAASVAAGAAGAAAAGVGAMAAQDAEPGPDADPNGPGDPSSGTDADLRGTGPGGQPEPTREIDPEEFDEGDGVTPPGGGHVRTIRRRQPSADDTVAMDAVEPIPPTPDPTEDETEDPTAWPSAIDDQHDDHAGSDPLPPPDDDHGGDRHEARDHRAPVEEADPAAVASTDDTDDTDDEGDDGDTDDGDGVHDDGDGVHDDGDGVHDDSSVSADDPEGDPIDVVAREQARLSASLNQLAQDVWERGDGA